MAYKVAARALVVWAGIVVLAVANGSLREAILIPMLGSGPALVLSGALLSVLILAVAYLSLPWVGARQHGALFAVGAGWLVLTLIFEFSFGHWQGKSWSALLEGYTFKGDNLWPVVLLVTACAPYLASRLRGGR